MLRTATLGLLLVIASTGPVNAIDLAPTPVDDAMRFELLAGRDDEFDDEEETKKVDSKQKAEQSTAAEGRKSVIRAGLYSALLPGLGEWYAGHHEKARLFFAGEAVTWIGFAAFRIYGNNREEDYIRYAATNANAQLEDKSDDFRDLVGFYEDIDQYNSFGRVFDPEREYLQDTPENHWRWQTEQEQAVYRNLKNRSREAYRRSDFMIGVAVVSRVISVIDAIRDVKRHNNRLDNELADAGPLRIEIDPLSPTQQIVLTLRTPF